MKLLFSITLLVTACLLAVGCTTAKVSSRRVLSSEDRAWATTQKIPLVVAVVPAEGLSPTNQWEMRSVSNLATNLIRTGLFKKVLVGDNDTDADLKVSVRKSYGVLRCGTGLILTKATLGLFRDNVAYSYVYDFEFASPRGSSTISFEKNYYGIYRIGFWPPRNEGFVELLCFDLLQLRQEMEDLAVTGHRSDGLSQTGFGFAYAAPQP